MTDIIERLLECDEYDLIGHLGKEAAAEIKRLREALATDRIGKMESMLKNARDILQDGGYVYAKEIDKFFEQKPR